MPPIFLKSYEANQNDCMLFLSTHVPGITLRNSDILLTDTYLKVNCRPFIWELFLNEEIDSKKSKITVGNHRVDFQLRKRRPGHWERINKNDFAEPSSLMESRLREMEKISESIRLERENIKSQRLKAQNDVTTHYHESVEEMKEKYKKVLKEEVLQTLNAETHESMINTAENILEKNITPIRAETCIKFHFTT